MRRKNSKVVFIFAITFLSLTLFMTALMSGLDPCREDSVYSHLYTLLIVILTIGICRCLFLAIPGPILCSKQTKLGHFHHSSSRVECNKKELSWGEFQL